MRLTCPVCSVTYEVPAKLLGDTPRRLRCARCQHDWMPETADPPALPPPDPPALPEPRREPPALITVGEPSPPRLAREPEARLEIEPEARLEIEPEVRRRRPPRGGGAEALAALAISAVLLVGLGVAAVVWRDAVMQGWPPSARAYALIGLH